MCGLQNVCVRWVLAIKNLKLQVKAVRKPDQIKVFSSGAMRSVTSCNSSSGSSGCSAAYLATMSASMSVLPLEGSCSRCCSVSSASAWSCMLHGMAGNESLRGTAEKICCGQKLRRGYWRDQEGRLGDRCSSSARYASLRSPSFCQLHCKFSLQTESFPSVVPAVQSEAGPMAFLRQAPVLCEMDVRPRCEQGILHAVQSKRGSFLRCKPCLMCDITDAEQRLCIAAWECLQCPGTLSPRGRTENLVPRLPPCLLALSMLAHLANFPSMLHVGIPRNPYP